MSDYYWSTCKCNIMQTWFLCFFGLDLQVYSTLHGWFSCGRTSGPVDDSIWWWGSTLAGILWGQDLVYWPAKSGLLWQGWQNHKLHTVAKSYGFDQVIFIVLIKFFSFEKFFSFLVVIRLLLDTLIYIWKFIFQQFIACKRLVGVSTFSVSQAQL